MNSIFTTYDSSNYVYFTFAGIKSELNKEGIEKKKPLGIPSWKDINKLNYKEYLNNGHHGIAIICGFMSGITVFDFDNADEYDSLILNNPELKKYKTIKTKKGYHIYCQYDASVLTTTNALININSVDIRNDSSIIFAPPTKYKLLDGTIASYEDLGGQILPIPNVLLNQLKQNNKPEITKQPEIINQPENTKKIKKIKIVENSDNDFSDDDDDDDEIDLELVKNLYQCYNEERILDHKKWVSLAQATANYTKEQGKLLFMEITNKYGTSNKMKECSTKYDFCKNKKSQNGKKVSIGSLIYWAKEDNKELYDNLFPIDKNKEIIVENDKEAADIIYSQINEKIKMSNGTLFYKHSNIWTSNDKHTHTAIRNYVLSSKIKKMSLFGPKSFAQNFTDADHITKIVIGLAMSNPDNSFYNKFVTTTKGKICFNNGVLDFIIKEFTEWDKLKNEVVSSVCINRDYNSIRNEEIIKNVKEQVFDAIFDNDSTKALQYLARGVAGHIEDKAWGLFTGNRDCGKGVIEGLNKNALECYVANINSSVFLCERINEGGDQAKKLSWTLELEFARLAFTQEMKFDTTNKNIKIDGTIIKKIASGGDVIQARKNYQDERNFIIQARLLLSGNDFPRIEPIDTMEKCNQFITTKQFKTQDFINQRIKDGAIELELQKYRVADDNIKNKCQTHEWIDAYIHLLQDNYKNTAVLVDLEANTSDDTTCLLINEIDSYFEITKNKSDRVTNAELSYWIQSNSINASMKKIKYELKSIGCKDYRSENVRGLNGIKIKEIIENENE